VSLAVLICKKALQNCVGLKPFNWVLHNLVIVNSFSFLDVKTHYIYVINFHCRTIISIKKVLNHAY
jgi:hypothetical protein